MNYLIKIIIILISFLTISCFDDLNSETVSKITIKINSITLDEQQLFQLNRLLLVSQNIPHLV